MERAKQLIDAAHAAGADAVKFQIRHLPATYQADVLLHPELQEQSFQYLIPLLKEFELSRDAYRELFRHARARGFLAFASAFDERNPAVLWSLQRAIKIAHRAGITSSICGQAPSNHPDLVQKLVKWGITSISVNPDAIARTREYVYHAEHHNLT